MIKNFVLDMGNVVLRWAPVQIACRLTRDPAGVEILRSELFGQREWNMLDRDQIDEKGAYRSVIKRVSPKYHPLIQKALDHWHEYIEPMPGAYAFMESLKKHGYKVYILTNASLRIREYEHVFPEFALADGLVVSAREKLAKPDRAFYDLLTDRYALKPEECLFLDDIQENVDGAIAAGWHGLVFDGDFAKLRETLGVMGIEV